MLGVGPAISVVLLVHYRNLGIRRKHTNFDRKLPAIQRMLFILSSVPVILFISVRPSGPSGFV